MKRFGDKPRVVVSGGGSGLGRAIALAFAKKQARVLVLDVNEAGAEETAALVAQQGGVGEALRCDVGEVADWERARDRMQAAFGGTDVLVNNAGIASAGRVGEMTVEDWRHVLRTNLEGTIFGCHVFVPVFRAQKSGFILNVASAGGLASLPMMAAYSLSKAGVISLSETLHSEVAGAGVVVSVVCPTFFPTNLMQSYRGTEQGRRIAQRLFDRPSAMTAADVAQAALAGLEAGKVLIIPQGEGRAMWRMKRFAPWLYFRMLKKKRISK